MACLSNGKVSIFSRESAFGAPLERRIRAVLQEQQWASPSWKRFHFLLT
jgi:hypothetical protein